MKQLLKKVSKGLVFISINVCVFYLINLGMNQLGNYEYVGKRHHTVRISEGAFTKKTFTKHHSSEGCEGFSYTKDNKYFSFGSMYTYSDDPCADGIVDDITTSEGSKTIRLTRKDDYGTHKNLFDKADKELAEAKEESKKHF